MFFYDGRSAWLCIVSSPTHRNGGWQICTPLQKRQRLVFERAENQFEFSAMRHSRTNTIRRIGRRAVHSLIGACIRYQNDKTVDWIGYGASRGCRWLIFGFYTDSVRSVWHRWYFFDIQKGYNSDFLKPLRKLGLCLLEFLILFLFFSIYCIF